MVSVQKQVQLETQKEVRWVSMPLSEVLEREMRFEASYFNAEGKAARQLIQNCSFEKLHLNAKNGFARVTYPGRFKRVFIGDGIPIFTSSQILELKPQANKWVSSKTAADFDPLYLREGQVVMTRSGSVGFCSYVGKTLSGLLFSDDLLRIECYNPMDAGYVYAFLKSKIGRMLITTNNYGSVVTHLEPEHLATLAVPNPPEKFKRPINEKVLRAFALRDDANALLAKSENLLSSALGLIPLKELKPKYFMPNGIRNFEVKTSDLALRFEAAYYAPLIAEIMKRLAESGAELVSLTNENVTTKVYLPGRFKRVFVSEGEGVPYFSGSELKRFDYSLKYLSRTANPAQKMKELRLNIGEILIACSGTIGDHLLVPPFMDGWVGSHDIIRLKPNQRFNSGYISAWLAHPYGQQLLLRQNYGSVVTHIDDSQIKKIMLPLLKPEKMNEIGNLVLKANGLRSEAWFLEKHAVQDVENLIKNNQK